MVKKILKDHTQTQQSIFIKHEAINSSAYKWEFSLNIPTINKSKSVNVVDLYVL